jgi:MoaA/NifB/PqqE/SkfB family radical SAM enzyme
MIIGLALPKHVVLQPDEVAVTFVVPAPGGCNMNCAFCAIRARAEDRPEEVAVEANDYVAFLRATARQWNVGVVSIQGHEALLPESWCYTREILVAAKALGLRTAMVTNGSFLADRAAELAALQLGSLTVSIDAPGAQAHDRIRGCAGAFDAAAAGIRAAIGVGMADRITIASVMQKARATVLEGMPRLIASLGLSRWVVTPVQSFGRVGGTVDTAGYILPAAKKLYIEALEAGISFGLDDELEAILCSSEDEVKAVEALHARRVQRAEQIIRLSPNGAVSRGAEIRRRLNETTTLWRPASEPADLLIRRLYGAPLRPALSLVAS